VVTAISNTQRYQSRYALYEQFEKYIADSGAILYTVEASFGDRPHVITKPDNPRHIRVHSHDLQEIWQKECLLNIGISRLPPSAKYIAWIDADVAFARPDWVDETIHQLQHYHFVQLFSHAIDLDPSHEPYNSGKGEVQSGFVAGYQDWVHEGQPADMVPGYGRKDVVQEGYQSSMTSYYLHPGFAHAARKEALSSVGGLMDFSGLGSSDHLMAWGLVGRMHEVLKPNLHPVYREWCLRWQELAERHIRRNIGYVPGTLLHMWHGPKEARRYNDRWDILTTYAFNPATDLKRDHQGLYQLEHDGSLRSTLLREHMRNYFAGRKEDAQYL
jgi:hypothetical protein